MSERGGGFGVVSERAASIKKGLTIEIVSTTWVVIEAVIGIIAGIIAHSLVLTVFGIDSVIEFITGSILLWRLWVEMNGSGLERVKRAEKTASWVVGIALLSLAVYIVAAAVYDLWRHKGAAASPPGMALALVAVFLMFYLAGAKKRIGKEIGSKALSADGSCSIVCAYMSMVLLAGVALTALFGWWWVDAAASLGLVYFVVKEGLEAVEAARGAGET